MAHEVYTTEAIVLSSTGVQDADKLFWLLTKDLGLLFVSAKSVREETSKLRYSLQDLSLVRVSLVRGRGLWRLTGAEENGETALELHDSKVFGRVAALVRRLVPTDEKNSDIFTLIRGARSALFTQAGTAESIETLTVARMLYRLGYLDCKDAYRGVVDTIHFDSAVIQNAEALVQKLIHDINDGLTESQL